MIRLVLASIAALAHAAGAAEPLDHEATIKGLRHGDAKAGRALYALHCASCHGKDGDLALNPLARRFAKDELKFGSDPYSLWKTTSYGNGLMFRWDAVLTEKERYQIVHHIREEIIKTHNPAQYFKIGDSYFDGLNERAQKDAEEQAKTGQKVIAAPGMIDGSFGKHMDYGPFLQHAVAYSNIEDNNAAHIENTTESAMVIRLSDDMAVCYDTARLSISGVWKLKDGKLADTTKTHHTSYKGSLPLRPSGAVVYKNIDEIGWQGGEIRFNGHYLHGNSVVLSYRIGGREVLELAEPSTENGLPARRFEISPGDTELVGLVLANPGGGASFDSTRVGSKSLLRDGGWLATGLPPSNGTTRFTLFTKLASDAARPPHHREKYLSPAHQRRPAPLADHRPDSRRAWREHQRLRARHPHCPARQPLRLVDAPQRARFLLRRAPRRLHVQRRRLDRQLDLTTTRTRSPGRASRRDSTSRSG